MKKLLTVPNLMIASVAGIGAYAVYRLVTAKKELQGGDYGGLATLGDPLQLSTNRFYKGRLRMKEANTLPFTATATQGALEAAMRLLGFTDVRVFMSKDDLPTDWPEQTIRNATPLTRWFQGQWKLPSAAVPRPSDLEVIWVTKPPAGASYIATTSGLGLPNPADQVTEDDLAEESG